jgi:GDPmannose 4,6-dehydratase
MDSSGTVMIFGHNGQDGTLLRESLAVDGIRVVGVSRDLVDSFDDNGGLVSSANRPSSVRTILEEHRPREIYYLAAEHHSSEGPTTVRPASDWGTFFSANVEPYESMLEGVFALGLDTRVFYAASSRVFEGSDASELDERSPYAPVSNYAKAKARGLELGANYRGRGVWVTSGILFNHESHLRPRSFFSSKVILGALAISSGSQGSLEVGDLQARTDWGYARDFVRAFRLVLGVQHPRDFIIATGESNTAERFIRLAFENFGLDASRYVVENPSVLGAKISLGVAQITRIEEQAGWAPSLNFEELITRLVMDHCLANPPGPALYRNRRAPQ